MIKKDFPERYNNAMILKADGSIDRDFDGEPKIDFSKIRNDAKLRKHLRSIK
jgi:hypothetical protein